MAGGGGTGAAAHFTLSGGNLTLVMDSYGSGYTSTATFSSVGGATTGIAVGISGYVKGLLTLSGGTLRTDAGVTSNRAVVLTGSSIIDTNSFDSTFSGILTGTGSITKTSSGTLTLSGTSTYTGATTVNAGTLAIGPGGALASASAITIGSSGTLNYAATGTATLSNTITGSGTLAITATKLILAGTNAATFTGTTTVTSASELVVNGHLGGTTSVSGLLTGTGTLTNLKVNSGGNLSPGSTGTAGTLTTTGTASWLAGGNYTWDVGTLAEAPTTSASNDLLQVTGGVGHTLDLTELNDTTNKFTVTVNALPGFNTPQGWNNGELRHSWVIATASSVTLPSGYTDITVRSLFTVNPPSGLTHPVGSEWYVTLSAERTSLILQYIPEPGTLSLLLLGALALLGKRNRPSSRRGRGN